MDEEKKYLLAVIQLQENIMIKFFLDLFLALHIFFRMLKLNLGELFCSK